MLKRHDLALLTVNDPPTKNSLSQTAPGNPNSDYQALGYGLGMLSIAEQDVRIGVAGSSVLGQWLPVANTQSLSGTDIDTQQSVIRFSSPLLPGMSGGPIYVVQGFRFQLWTHLESGATLAVPDDVTLAQQGNVCIAATSNGTFEQVISASPAANQLEVNQVSIAFEQQVVVPKITPNIGAYPDQVLTTWGPQQRSDGLVVNRKAYFFGRQQQGPGRFKATHQFETLMARDGTFVGFRHLIMMWNSA